MELDLMGAFKVALTIGVKVKDHLQQINPYR